jgi:uncharacterized membrane protein
MDTPRPTLNVRLDPTNVRLWSTAGTAVALYAAVRRRSPMWLAVAVLAGSTAYRAIQKTGLAPRAAGKRPGRGDMPTLTEGRGIKVERAITIARPPRDLYRFWRRLENLPRVLPHVTAVTTISPTRSHWVAAGPAGSTLEWDADIVADRENELIAWRSLEGSDIDHGGSVHFTPLEGERGTEARIVLNVALPTGRVGGLVAMAFGEHPDQEVLEGLRRFRQILEGEETGSAEAGPRAPGAA